MTKAFHLKKSKLKPKEAGNSLAIQSLRFGVFTIVGLHLKITKKKKKREAASNEAENNQRKTNIRNQ